jgi:integrase
VTIRIVKGTPPSSILHLVVDYLASCQARGLVPRSLKQYEYALDAVFLPWCEREGITDIGQLDRPAVDRFTSELLSRTTEAGQPLSKHSVATYIRPIRLLLNWASREGEDVEARPQLPRRERPIRDILSRAEIEQLERAMTHERDRLIIRVFGDCGLRLEELSRLTAGDLIQASRRAHFRVHGKRDRIRDVPVPPILLRRIERLIAMLLSTETSS